MTNKKQLRIKRLYTNFEFSIKASCLYLIIVIINIIIIIDVLYYN